MKKQAAVVVVAALLTGCASKANEITATYVSPVTYEAYTCVQLSQEAERVSTKAAELAGVQDSAHSKDVAITAVSAVVFWPALFFIKGDKTNATALANVRGQMEAIEQTSIRKKCGIDFKRS